MKCYFLSNSRLKVGGCVYVYLNVSNMLKAGDVKAEHVN
jgi:hypothetical protein